MNKQEDTRYGLHVAFSRTQEQDYVLATDYLRLRRQGPTPWVPDVEHCGLSLIAAGIERTLYRRSIGRYPDFVSQFSLVSERLLQGAHTLLRTAVDDTSTGTYFLLEPEGEAVQVSLFYITERDISFRYPVPGRGSEELYSYFNTHRDLLLSADADEPPEFCRLPFPTALLLREFAREADVAKEILSFPEFTAAGY
jgi:hypothetical protein